MVGKTLTPMQEKFCENIVYGDMTFSDAFRNSYNTENYKPESVNRKACEMMGMVNILSRVDEMKADKKEAILKAAVYGYKEHMEELNEIRGKAMKSEDERQLNTALKATELKGKSSELYNFTQKVDNIGNPQVVVSNTIDAEALNELSSK